MKLSQDDLQFLLSLFFELPGLAIGFLIFGCMKIKKLLENFGFGEEQRISFFVAGLKIIRGVGTLGSSAVATGLTFG